MKYVDDVTKLFESFGETAGSYQEIQPSYKNFKDGLTPLATSMIEQDFTEALPQATTAVFLLDAPTPFITDWPAHGTCNKHCHFVTFTRDGPLAERGNDGLHTG
ncbi:hypothetical protein RHM58_24260 [Pseudomonas sp. 10S4]|uniref:hypothetical protein n=1 Tax=Pseudomonas sp. 10S4 TaxID=3048583 RepID=UPI002AC9025E|nr:hypothetical protein [Pseudomonas sp. 10S4]WPX17025.1 hypothetical protein RHM58_24260 [Pseudomonas sp. 10S4]